MANIVIIGGGQGGTTMLKALNQIDDFKVLGISDVNSAAAGIRLARELGIPAYSDISDLLDQPGIDVIIEATGVPAVREMARSLKPEGATMVDSTVANVMMTFMEGHEAVLKRSRSKKLAFQTSAPFLTRTYGRDGVVYFTSGTAAYDFVEEHNLTIPGVQTGAALVQGGNIEQCVKSRQPLTAFVSRNVYGISLQLWVAPIFEDDDENLPVIGTYGVYTPQMHPIEKAFDIFAPIVIDSQPEGAWACVTDLEKIVAVRGSEKFTLEGLPLGTNMTRHPVVRRVLDRSTKYQSDTSDKVYGHCRTTGIPLFDENTRELVGIFALTVPRNLAANLQEMSGKLQGATTEMAHAMQGIASSATEINGTGGILADRIQAVKENAANIAEITGFTKNVAEETKMLGLNAAIEAARAGEHGRGFGVVAEEIRKLSDESRRTADQITRQIKEIEAKVQEAVAISGATLKQSEEQAAATEQVTAAVSGLAHMADQLSSRAKSL